VLVLAQICARGSADLIGAHQMTRVLPDRLRNSWRTRSSHKIVLKVSQINHGYVYPGEHTREQGAKRLLSLPNAPPQTLTVKTIEEAFYLTKCTHQLSRGTTRSSHSHMSRNSAAFTT
jgi:hypothetical protein